MFVGAHLKLAVVAFIIDLVSSARKKVHSPSNTKAQASAYLLLQTSYVPRCNARLRIFHAWAVYRRKPYALGNSSFANHHKCTS